MCSGRAAQGASKIWFENLYVIKEVSKLAEGAGPNLKRRYVVNVPVDTWKMGSVLFCFYFCPCLPPTMILFQKIYRSSLVFGLGSQYVLS
jgi:hypothetical protein